jgi:ubiquinone/menaquinone biosynthesis C-methylase UbiE
MNARPGYSHMVVVRVDYDDRQWAVYEKGRGLSRERTRLWSRVLARYIDRTAGPSLLDLGSGTGAYSELLAEAFNARVIGVEPSPRMREVAEREHSHPHVRYIDGTAERIPLPDGSCDAALLSNVLHHVRDRGACVSELERVVRPGGLVLVRGSLRGARVPFLDYFPTARVVAVEQSPPAPEVVAMFTSGGFEHVESDRIEQQTASSFREYYRRIKLRAISTLELISDGEFEQGIERMRKAAEGERSPRPVIEDIDLLVFRRA